MFLNDRKKNCKDRIENVTHPILAC